MKVRFETYNLEDNTVRVYRECGVTGKEYSLTLPTEKYEEFRSRRSLIQDVFPDLSIEEREFLISGHTPAEWDSIFGGWEE